MKRLRITTFLLALAAVGLFADCAGLRRVGREKAIQVTVVVDRENLCNAPGGGKIAEARAGDIVSLVQRRGNWCRVVSSEVGDAWIWGPSLGLERIDPLSLELLIGGDGEYIHIDELTTVFGQPTGVEPFGGGIFIYSYENHLPKGGTLFGTKGFRELRFFIDRRSRAVLGVEIVLPPFEGRTGELLARLGLPEAKSTENDFEQARYDEKFDCAGRVDLKWAGGDFTRFERVVADKVSPNRWKRQVTVLEKNSQVDGGEMTVVLTLANGDKDYAYGAAKAEVALYDGRNRLGSWVIGPAPELLRPGGEIDARFPVPMDVSRFDPMQLSMTVELVEMMALPKKP